MNQTICSNTKRENSSTVGGATIVTMQGNPNQQTFGSGGAGQKVGKKTFIHQDQAHYELYMQFKQMAQIGEEIKNQSIEASQLKSNREATAPKE